ncbi:MAG TPA: SurA N-terminal domain-containing protein [Thermodesulfobacteriota bacterium]|nr:SurA N-terminal domain-containing protein [Thermodesulfobacteriota bacterium]
MLEFIRKRTKSLYILLVFAAIIVVFVFWGVGPSGPGGGDANVVATVDDEVITLREYTDFYRRQVEYYRDVFKDRYTPEFEETLNLKKVSMDILINRSLAVAEGDAQGIGATKEEAQDLIMSMPAFQEDGVFNKERYFEALDSQRIKPAEFEEAVRRDIITAKMRESVVKEITVTEDETEAEYLKDNRHMNLNYITVDPAGFTGEVEVTDEDAREHLKANSTEFIVPAKVKAFYAYADFEKFRKRAKVKDTEIKGYYEANPGQFMKPAEVKASHILMRPEGEGEGPKEDARKRAEGLIERIKGGEDFAKLAREFSKDPGSASRGGDLGWFQAGVMVKSFEDAAFSLKKGEVSAPVETPFGWHVIKVEDRKEPEARPLLDVRDFIEKRLAVERAYEGARGAVRGLEELFKTEEDTEKLKKAAGEAGLEMSLTGYFTQEDLDVGLSQVERFRDIVFLLQKGETSGAVETMQGFYILKVVDRKDAYLPEYSEVAGEVKGRLTGIKAGELARKKVDELLARLKGGEGAEGGEGREDLKTLAKKEGYRLRETGPFTRAEGFIPGLDAFVGENEAIFALGKENPLYPEALANEGRFYLLEFNGSMEADLKDLTPEAIEALRERLLQEKQEQAVNAWLAELRKKYKIMVFEDRL